MVPQIATSPRGTYQQWIAKWWQWDFSVPAAHNAIEMYCPQNRYPTGQQCPEWFEADSFNGTQERTCPVL
ncbi:MAG: hypothetical protein WCF23_08545 [Candidatus Nitrosopolaris sp.]